MNDSGLPLFEWEISPRHSLGARIRVAREGEGLLIKQLAELVDKSPEIVGKWESGKSGLHSKTLERVADVLDYPLSFFRTDDPIARVTRPDFRVTVETPKYKLARFSAFAVLAGELLRLVDTHAPGALPATRLTSSNRAVAKEQAAELAALSARRVLVDDSAAIDNAVLAAERLGVIVVYGPPETESVDAFSVWAEGRPVIVLNPARTDYLRLRFDVAHELGHLIMHEELSADAPDWERSKREDEAHRFARTFLAPNSFEFDSRLKRAVRTFGWEALGAILRQVEMPLREVLTLAQERDASLRSIASARAVEANANPDDVKRVTPSKAPERLALFPDLLELASFNARVPLDDLALIGGIPTRYSRLGTIRELGRDTRDEEGRHR